MPLQGVGSRLVALAITLGSGLALAGPYRGSSGTSGGCCTVIVFGLFVWIYRSGGADWLRALGATAFPGLFGWFIWRDRELGTGSRWLALITACFQVLSVVTGIAIMVAVKAGAFDRFLPPGLLPGVVAEASPSPIDLSKIPEDESLGLHPLSSITTDPSGAKVFINGQLRGTTPLETPLTAGERNAVKVELDGYFPAEQERIPNARERLMLRFTLTAAARLKVTSEPPGARVLAGMKEVLARTPGASLPMEAGQTEVLVLLAGYQPHRQTLTLATGDTPLEVTLTPGVKIAVSSTPDQADILVDGQWVGLTPSDVYVSPRKHTVEVKKESWAPAKKVFPSVKGPTTFEARLVDSQRVVATRTTTRARARYDQVNQALEKLQARLEVMPQVPDKLERQLLSLEREMEKAASALEKAEAELKAIEEARASGQPLPESESESESGPPVNLREP